MHDIFVVSMRSVPFAIAPFMMKSAQWFLFHCRNLTCMHVSLMHIIGALIALNGRFQQKGLPAQYYQKLEK